MTDEQKAVLAAEIAKAEYKGKTPREIARMLNKWPQVSNPLPAPKVPAPFEAKDVTSMIVAVSKEANVRLVSILAEQNHGELRDFGKLCGVDLSAVADKVIPDPNWPAMVRGDSKTVELGLTPLEWGGMTFTNSVPRGAVEEVL